MTALATFAVVTALLTGFVRLGHAVTEQARLQSVADGVALAAADHGEEVARYIAQSNGISDVATTVVVDDILVTVSRDGLVARARASTAP